MLRKLVTPEVLQPTPLKKNLVPRFGARDEKGKTDCISQIGYMKDYIA
jgi:hypothetical protein